MISLSDSHDSQEPKLKRLVVDRATQAALVEVLADAPDERIMYVSSEPTMLDEAAGTRAQSRPEVDVLVKGYSGEPIVQDRKTSGHCYIEEPAITVGVTVQPDSLRHYAHTHHAGEAESRGFLARFLICQPKPPGPKVFPDAPIPRDVVERYHANMTRLWRLTGSRTVSLEPAADAALLDFARKIERRMHDVDDPLASEVAWASKLRGNVLRIAGVLHALDAENEAALTRPINSETMGRALKIGEYLIAHALSAFGHMRESEASRDAAVVLAWLAKRGKPTQARRDIQRGNQRIEPQRLDAALRHLVSTGHIRPAKGANNFDIHPSVIAGEA